jgi:hypothetical protein
MKVYCIALYFSISHSFLFLSLLLYNLIVIKNELNGIEIFMYCQLKSTYTTQKKYSFCYFFSEKKINRTNFPWNLTTQKNIEYSMNKYIMTNRIFGIKKKRIRKNNYSFKTNIQKYVTFLCVCYFFSWLQTV